MRRVIPSGDIFISLTVLQRMTRQNKFCNISAYATVNYSTWSFVCDVTICPLIVEGLIAGTDGTLFEFYNLEKSNFKIGGSFFQKL